jgi:hypothetical protein
MKAFITLCDCFGLYRMFAPRRMAQAEILKSQCPTLIVIYKLGQGADMSEFLSIGQRCAHWIVKNSQQYSLYYLNNNALSTTLIYCK